MRTYLPLTPASRAILSTQCPTFRYKDLPTQIKIIIESKHIWYTSALTEVLAIEGIAITDETHLADIGSRINDYHTELAMTYIAGAVATGTTVVAAIDSFFFDYNIEDQDGSLFEMYSRYFRKKHKGGLRRLPKKTYKKTHSVELISRKHEVLRLHAIWYTKYIEGQSINFLAKKFNRQKATIIKGIRLVDQLVP